MLCYKGRWCNKKSNTHILWNFIHIPRIDYSSRQRERERNKVNNMTKHANKQKPEDESNQQPIKLSRLIFLSIFSSLEVKWNLTQDHNIEYQAIWLYWNHFSTWLQMYMPKSNDYNFHDYVNVIVTTFTTQTHRIEKKDNILENHCLFIIICDNVLLKNFKKLFLRAFLQKPA